MTTETPQEKPQPMPRPLRKSDIKRVLIELLTKDEDIQAILKQRGAVQDMGGYF